MKESKQSISFGDNVKIRSTTVTEENGLAGLSGQVYGETTPSVTDVEVVGDISDDYAINVHIEEKDEAFCFAPGLLEFIDHGAGTEISVGNVKAVRREDGSWQESGANDKKRAWWRIW